MSDGMNFQQFMANERDRLASDRERWNNAAKEAADKITEIDREVAAMDTYEAVLSGKMRAGAVGGGATRAVRNGARGPNRVRRGSVRETLINTISAAPTGLKRGEILEKLGVKGNKTAEGTLSNALFVMTRDGQIERTDGYYRVAKNGEDVVQVGEEEVAQAAE